MSNLTLILNLSERIGIEGRSGINVRTPSPLDTIALGVLYFDSYPPGIADSTPEEATADIAASFAGDYGELWLEASPVAATDDGLVGAVLTVRQAPWSDTPDGPFVIELFTAPDHRRKEIGRSRIERSYRATCCESMITGSGPPRSVDMARVRYMVDDVDDAVAFYVSKLGFELDQQFGPAIAILVHGDLELLVAGPRTSAAKPMLDGSTPGPGGGWSRFVLTVDDLESYVSELKKAGVEFRNEIVEMQGRKQILCVDPSGNVIELFEAP